MMAYIIDLEYLKYQKEFIENNGIIDHSQFINSIQFHKIYNTEIDMSPFLSPFHVVRFICYWS